MGYTHYWYREKMIGGEEYGKIVEDFKKLMPIFAREGVQLAGGFGEGEPEVSGERVWFNGKENCGHEHYELGITWPAPAATGVGATSQSVDGHWFAGRLLEKRCCGGDCSHETLHFPKVYEPRGDWDKPQMEKGLPRYFEFCKTAYKPYDWPVTAFLLIAKHYLGDKLLVSSDGESEHWQDARLICQLELGYGMEFQLDKED